MKLRRFVGVSSRRGIKMMMDYNSMSQGMMGGSAGTAMIFMWLTYLLFIVILVLGIAALWKYITKK